MGCGVRLGDVQQAVLRALLALGGQQHVSAVLGLVDAQPEPLVRFVQQQGVGGVRAEDVPPDPVGTPGVVHSQVDQRVVAAPAAPARDLDRRDGHLAAVGQVDHPQPVALVAADVLAEGEPASVGGDVAQAEREERLATGEFVLVEHDLFALGDWVTSGIRSGSDAASRQ